MRQIGVLPGVALALLMAALPTSGLDRDDGVVASSGVLRAYQSKLAAPHTRHAAEVFLNLLYAE